MTAKNIMSAIDKKAHLLLMFVGTLLAALLTRNVWIAGAIALCIGVGKEVYDATVGTTGFSMDDMVANTLGIFAGMLVYIAIAGKEE